MPVPPIGRRELLRGSASLALALTLFAGCSRDDDKGSPLRLRVEEVQYGSDPNQSADLHVPLSEGPHQVVMIVHGGYWAVGLDRQAMRPIAEELVQIGYAVWNVDYRRVGEPGGGFPGTVEDVGAAIDHLAELAEEHRLDLTKVAVVGHSAGSPLALWTAAREAQGIYAPGGAPRVKPAAVTSLSGVLDLEAASRLPDEGRLGDLQRATVAFLGGTPEEVPGHYAVVSPMRSVPLGIPQLLMHGVDDEIVPFQLTTNYRDAALAAGDPVTSHIVPNVDHFQTAAADKAWWSAVLNWLPVAFGTPPGT